MKWASLVCLSLGVLVSSAAIAKPIKPYECRNGYFPNYTKGFSQAQVVVPNVHFMNDMLACPYDTEKCAMKAYIVKGDNVLVAQRQDGWSCVWYHGRRHEYVGWMEQSALRTLSTETPNLSAWIGHWGYYNTPNVISIRKGKKAGTLYVEGEAIWEGIASVNSGSFSGVAKVKGNHLSILQGEDSGPYACRVKLTLINGSLIASDNHQCGGMNVTFSNVYTKKRLRTH